MSSVRVIAREAGVSIATVSRVLNNHPRVSAEVRDRVLAAANQQRYVAQVGKRSTANVAILYTGELSLGSTFDAQLMWGMTAGLEEYGYDLMVLDAKRSMEPGETYTQMLMRKGVRGLVLRTTQDTRKVCLAIAEEGFPAVVVGDRFDHNDVRFVYSDSREPSHEAVEHLIALGHTRIGICLNNVEDSDHGDRLEGYRQALDAHGLAWDRKLVFRVPAHRPGGAQLIRRVAAMTDRPTALYITDPATSAGAFKEARTAGLQVPGDLSIVGFDDTETRFGVYPEMSAVCQDTAALGREALDALHEVIASGPDKPAPVRKALRAWFEVHESTAAPPAKA